MVRSFSRKRVASFSADRFSRAAHSAQVGVFDHDHDTGAVYWCPCVRVTLGVGPRTRPTERLYMRLTHPDDRADLSRRMAQARVPSSGGMCETEHRIAREDGSIRWVYLKAKTFFAGTGVRRRPMRTTGVIFDITARKQLEQTLRDNEGHYRTIFDQIYEFVGLTNPEGRMIDANRCALEFAGTTKDQVVGLPLWETPWWRGLADDQARLKAAIERAASGEFVRMQTANVDAKGRIENIDFSLSPVRDEQGKVVGLIPEGRRVGDAARAAGGAAAADAPLLFNNENGGHRAEEVLLRAILESSDEGIITIDERGRIGSFSLTAERLFGYVSAEVIGRNVSMLMASPDRQRHDIYLDQYARGGEPGIIGIGREVQARRKDGSVFPIHLTVNQSWLGERRVFTGLIRDLSLLKATEQALRDTRSALLDSHRLNAEVLDSINEGIGVYDKDLVCVARNRFMAELSGLPNDQVIGRALLDQQPELEAHGLRDVLRRVLGGETVALDHPLGRIKGSVAFLPPGAEVREHADPNTVWVWPVYHPRRSRSGEIIGVILVSADGTARKRADDALRESHAKVRALAQKLERAREEERQRLSRELHDEMAQLLTALRIDANWLKKKLAEHHAQLSERAEAMAGVIESIQQTTKRIAGELRPKLLDDGGLPPALKSLAAEFGKRTGVVCELRIDGAGANVADPVATLLYRAAQEALTNVAKHADAVRVGIHLNQTDNEVTLEVRDDGKGLIDTDQSKRGSFGLLGMRERIAGANGDMTLASAPGQGTLIRISVPLTPVPSR